MPTSRIHLLSFLCAALMAGILPAGRAETIVLHSGNGSIGSPDAQIHFRAGGSAVKFTAADFEAARTGTVARAGASNSKPPSGVMVTRKIARFFAVPPITSG